MSAARPASAPGTSGGGLRRTAVPWVFVGVLVLVSLNLRAPFVAVAPISTELRSDLGVGGAAVGVLTSLPVLCFGLLAPVALAVIRRAGIERAVSLCLLVVVVGSVVRSLGGYPLAVAGTLLVGLAITVGNVVVPVVIRRETPMARVGVVTGVYVTAMNVGSMVVTLATAPISQAFGWRVALAVWALPALVGLGAWGWWQRRAARQADARVADEAEQPPAAAAAEPPGDVRIVWRTPIAWLLGLAFAGQASSYYALTAWLPSLLADEIGLGATGAGTASSVFQVSAIVGAFGVPLLATRFSPAVTIAIVGALWMTFPLQLLVSPELYVVGSVLGGIAQGGGFAAIFTIVVQVSRTDRESAQLSAFVQGVGYVVAATGPAVLGLAHDVTDAWTVPVLVVLGTTATFAVLGTLAGAAQSRHHGAPA
ncbi:MFS transporter, CP family, cyanate transporter [Nocardioides scoriae]|uniref:MFS transporter, CP family, cyanate transporter n=1 Tax=Nocardioides scoriae TaxID=642780 RepID=A0A1H1V877_9ACTN|nr:MFS transporter [Nocardioides scoriae]SDS80691.1 MFS transporter, CP family, cyanate transporter [Nocardioides scoriae]